MLNFVDRMIVQAEMDYRGEKLRRSVSPKRRNRFAEHHHHSFPGAPEVVKRAR
ncbi:hypothetical protein [Nocardioides sp.]|uniref:hypothetical protein n=1 Tax=Nocardioides sp. TaxID=35761 RepID=UPI00239537A2|nr:hypothetical protein [Nocardioides sp.]MDE0778122.1 hypothetical protein [Nocardioides sp.]